ncbi:NADPH oxidase organizer 1-like [Sardina pilchardus]|uniref:NADPH oxidase organizer 1-like n=1 Tax=Sardina pilchardus TaxID=27697 RepID=UPI002E1331CE
MDDQRFPANVRIIGVMLKDKVKMFMTSVVWSDRNEVIIYRSFQDFKKLHKQLKKKHPSATPLCKSDRILPRFRGVKRNFKKKGPSKSVHRVKALEKYSTELFQCDPSVAQSSEIIQFFRPKDHDLQPDFAKNSILIVPSDDLGEGTGNKQSKCLSMGNVTQPFLTQTYRTVAPYETKDTKNRPFKVDVDQTLDVLIKDQKGWWLVENEEKCLAWFPAPYLEPCDEQEDEDDFEAASFEDTLYCAARNYVSKKRDEVSVNIGSVVEVLRKSDDGWWLIRYNGRVGYVPSMYLQPYNNPYFGLQKKLHSSTFNLSQLPGSLRGRLAPTGHSRSMEDLLEPSRVRARSTLDNAASAAISTDRQQLDSSMSMASDDTDFSFSSSGSLSGTEAEQSPRVFSHGASPRGSPRGSPSSSVSGSPRGSPRGSPSSSASGSPRGSPSSSASGSPSSSPSSSASGSSIGSPSGSPTTARVPPRVPPRPQTQEIFARCTTCTRKAAMASRARLLPQQREIQAR